MDSGQCSGAGCRYSTTTTTTIPSVVSRRWIRGISDMGRRRKIHGPGRPYVFLIGRLFDRSYVVVLATCHVATSNKILYRRRDAPGEASETRLHEAISLYRYSLDRLYTQEHQQQARSSRKPVFTQHQGRAETRRTGPVTDCWISIGPSP